MAAGRPLGGISRECLTHRAVNGRITSLCDGAGLKGRRPFGAMRGRARSFGGGPTRGTLIPARTISTVADHATTGVSGQEKVLFLFFSAPISRASSKIRTNSPLISLRNRLLNMAIVSWSGVGAM